MICNMKPYNITSRSFTGILAWLTESNKTTSVIPDRTPDKLRICAFYATKTSKNACIIRSECTHYAYILLCKQTFQIRSVLVQSCT